MAPAQPQRATQQIHTPGHGLIMAQPSAPGSAACWLRGLGKPEEGLGIESPRIAENGKAGTCTEYYRVIGVCFRGSRGEGVGRAYAEAGG